MAFNQQVFLRPTEKSTNETVLVDTSAQISGKSQQTGHTDHNYGKPPLIKMYKKYSGSVVFSHLKAYTQCPLPLHSTEIKKEPTAVECKFIQQVSEQNNGLTVSSHQLSEQTHDLAASSQQVSEQTHDLAASSQQVSEQTHDLAASSQQVSEQTHDLAAFSQQVSEQTHDLAASSQQVSEQTHDLAASSQQVSEQTHGLAASSQQVSEQTHGLAASKKSTNETVLVDTSTQISGESQQTVHTDHNYGKPYIKIYKKYSGSVVFSHFKAYTQCLLPLHSTEIKKEPTAVEYKFIQQVSEQNNGLAASSQQVSEQSHGLATSSQQVSEQTHDLAASSQQVSEQTHGLATSSQQVSEQTHDLAASSQQVSEQSYGLAASSQQVSEQNNGLTRLQTAIHKTANVRCLREAQKPYACLFCERAFRSRQALSAHRVTKHPEKTMLFPKRAPIPCPDCTDIQLTSQRDLVLHLAKEHNKEMCVMSRKFNSENEFKMWKSRVERETFSKFISRNVAREDFEMRKYYYCHRSGKRIVLTDRVGLRKPKKQGSCKTNAKCTAYMIARTDLKDKTVDVEYCLNHLGHDFDLAHLQISADVRKSVARQLSEGVDPDDIIEAIRNSSSKVSRDSFLTLKDIHNISKRFNIPMPTTEEKSVYTCRICNSQFKSRNGLKLHQSKKHKGMSSSSRVTNKTATDVINVDLDEPIMVAQVEASTAEDVSEDCGTGQCEFDHMGNVDGHGLQKDTADPSDMIDQLKKRTLDKLNTFRDVVAKSNDISFLENFYKIVTDVDSFAFGPKQAEG
ncbi:hypothetical protein EGW08_018949 [Elysia chlorotica]|uniref:C2H2-type domain-containing protein n=1 Tax=Elysia chlorotica TaxID=188477 RepID=A0A433SVI9_ELYCH|nr:hypothetical protein EGW08_018949 [Elysia chlorotica]